MNELAINLLLVPDDETRKRVEALNAALRDDLGSGFAFDETHLPHITVLQRPIAGADLDAVLAAAAVVAETRRTGDLRLSAIGLVTGALDTTPPIVLVSADVERRPALATLQMELVAALASLAAPRLSRAAFFALPGESPVGDGTVRYVERFAVDGTGQEYSPHLSLGLGDERLASGLTNSFQPFEVIVTALAACRLGAFGTAREVLGRWPLD